MTIDKAGDERPSIRVFEYRPGAARIRRGWLCAPCVEQSSEIRKANEVEGPVALAAVDLDGKTCALCGKPFTDDICRPPSGAR